MPTRAVGRVAADAGRAAPSARRPRPGAAVGGPAARAAAAARPPCRRRPASTRKPSDHAPRKTTPVTVDLGPYLDAVPQAVVDRLRGARRVLAVGHENPDADTLGATLGVVRLVEAIGAARRPGLHRPDPAAVRLHRRRGAFPDRPGPDRAVRPASSSPTAARSSGSATSAAGTPSCSPGCRASSSTTTPRTTPTARPTGSTRRRPRPARWSTLLAARLGLPLDAGGGALAADLMAGIVMDTATFAHPNATPRTLVVSAALVEAGAPLADISRRLYRTQARRPAAAVRHGPRSTRELRRRPDRVVEPDRGGPRPRPAPTAPHSRGHHRPAVAGRRGRGRRSCSRRPAPRRACQRPDEAGRRRRHGPHRPVRRRRPRSGGRCDRGRRRSPRRDRPSSPRRAGSSPRWPADRGPLVAGSRASTASSSSPSRPVRPRTTSSRWSAGWPRRNGSATAGRSIRSRPACFRSSWATRRGSSSTTWAIGRPTARRSASARRRRPTTSRAS